MASTSGVQSRSKDKIFLVGFPIHQITGCKLPSNRQVLCALFYNLRTVKLTLRESAKLTIREVLIFWQKARIPAKDEQNAITKLEKLHVEWRILQKDRKKTSETIKNKFKQFVEKLGDLFDIAQQDALNLMKSEVDKAFLMKQRQKGRPGCMSGVDRKLSRAEEIKAQKELERINRQIQEEYFDIGTDDEYNFGEEEDTQEDIIYQELENLEAMDIPEEAAEDLGPSDRKRMKVSYARGVHEILNMKLSILLDRCKVSDRNATRILIATLEALNLDPLKYKVSKTLLHTRRKMFREQYTKNILHKVNIPEKEAVVVHWDGKLLPGVLKNEQCERIAIAISYGGKEQLLGVPVTENSSGEEQALAVYECLQQWCLANTVKAMCFDTTASNTGRFKGACVILQQMLGRELLHLACRHHILEIMLRGVFDTKMGSTTGPHPDIFKRFLLAWPKIDKQKYDTGISDNLIQKQLSPELIAHVTAEFKKKLTENHPRDDYKELLQLVLVFVGSLDGNVVGFRTPGAIHHARWMAKAIYCFKIFIFRRQFKMSRGEESSVSAIAVFLVKIYCKAWFNAPKAHLAPKQDLDILRSLLDYKECDNDIAEIALTKFSNHLWYLNTELVGLSFFDPTITDDEKLLMANKLLSSTDEPSEQARVVNPKVRKEKLEELVDGGLINLLSKETFNFFDRFNIKIDFLRQNPNTWPQNNNFQEGLKIVKTLKVVNDMAERGIKLITDFNDLLTKDEEQKQYVLQVVSKCRTLYPDVSKSTLTKALQ